MKNTNSTPLNKHKHYNPDAVTSIEAIRACSRMMPQVSPRAYVLSRYLATWWNGSNKNGVVNPSQRRIYFALNMSETIQRTAASELEQAGWWKPAYGQQGISSFKPLFLDQLTITSRAQLKSIRSSLVHNKVDARYFRIPNLLGKALTGYAVERIEPRFDDLGYNHFMRTNQKNKIHSKMNHGKKSKIVHSVFFEHPMIQSHDPKIWAALARTKRVPVSWTDRPLGITFTIADFLERVKAPLEDFKPAIEAINESGFWHVDHNPDVFGLGEVNLTDELVFTPLYPLHQMVWDLDLAGGGQGQSEWETRRGMGENDEWLERDLPPLGYHFVYGLRSVMTGKFLIVGQTTQPLTNRLNQHMRQATNPDANAAIKWVVMSRNDSLEIVHLGTVFIDDVATYEIEKTHEFLGKGHPIQNKVLTVTRNRGTIKPDERFGGLVDPSMEGEFRKVLDRRLSSENGARVLWETDEEFLL